MPTMIKKEADI